MRAARRMGALLAAAPVLALAGCIAEAGAGKLPASAVKVKIAAIDVDGGRQSVLTATALADGARFFARPPFDLHGSWRVEATCGIYDEEAVTASTGVPFGIEVDLRGATPTPAKFYALYATRAGGGLPGLSVSASSHGGLTFGTVFLPNATKADLVIETDGFTVYYRARPAGSTAAYSNVGTRSLDNSSLAHQAGFGMSGARKGASFGFTNFRIPVHGAAPVAPPPEQDALNSCYEAALAVLDAAYAVDDPLAGTAEVDVAQAHVDVAIAAIESARTKIDALADQGTKSPARRARGAVRRALVALNGAKDGFEKKDVREIRPFLKAVAKPMFAAAFSATDALLPEALRVALPGGELSK